MVEVTGRRGAPIRSQSAVRFSTSALAAVMLTLACTARKDSDQMGQHLNFYIIEKNVL